MSTYDTLTRAEIQEFQKAKVLNEKIGKITPQTAVSLQTLLKKNPDTFKTVVGKKLAQAAGEIKEAGSCNCIYCGTNRAAEGNVFCGQHQKLNFVRMAEMKKQEESTVINTAENNSQQNIEENHLQQNGKVDNTLIWIQAFMPLLGALFIGGTVAIFLINSVILYFDCEKLKKAGYDVEELGNSWIVPVYIYKRAEYFNHGKGYFIVWCIAFGISFFGFA